MTPLVFVVYLFLPALQCFIRSHYLSNCKVGKKRRLGTKKRPEKDRKREGERDRKRERETTDQRKGKSQIKGKGGKSDEQRQFRELYIARANKAGRETKGPHLAAQSVVLFAGRM